MFKQKISMCGIFAYLAQQSDISDEMIQNEFLKISHRGPDSQTITKIYKSINNLEIIFGFHRLAIMGLNKVSDQPLYYGTNGKIVLICNGEIFNYKQLIEKYQFDYKSQSDCEIILHLYERFGIEQTVNSLDGEFAFVLADLRDERKPLILASRDPIGVRPLFISRDDENHVIGFCSELKGLHQLSSKVEQFQSGHYMVLDLISRSANQYKYYDFTQSFGQQFSNSTEITKNELSTINNLLTRSVHKRLMSDRPVGLFISGGLDSSLVAAIATRNSLKKLDSFAIGLKGYQSNDLIYARKVAEFLGTNHHEVTFTLDEGLASLVDVIKHLESYDVTTVRASTPMYLLSKYIKEKTETRVILTGEAPDELLGGYLYFHYAPSLLDFQKETETRISELPFYDVLRADRATAAWGLEVRVPYLDKTYLNYCINLDPQLKSPQCNNGIEKFILRKAFDDIDCPYLPHDILWRPKEAFSDGVGYSWKDTIIKYSEEQISDELFEKRSRLYPVNTPMTKEGFLYRQIYETFYSGRDHVIPRFWMPKWVDNITDPSATVLKVHSTRMTQNIQDGKL